MNLHLISFSSLLLLPPFLLFCMFFFAFVSLFFYLLLTFLSLYPSLLPSLFPIFPLFQPPPTLSHSLLPSSPLFIYLAFYPSSPIPFLKRQPKAFRPHNTGGVEGGSPMSLFPRQFMWTASPRRILQSPKAATYLPSIRNPRSPFGIWLNFKKQTPPYRQIYT